MSLYLQGIATAESGQIFDQDDLIVHPTIDTTMRVMAEMIHSREADKRMRAAGTKHITVMALQQTAGIGSVDPDTGKQRVWWSGKGTLLASRGIRKENWRAKETEFPIALAWAEVIAKLLPRAVVMLKFPNDILVDGAKIGGVLTRPEEHSADIVNAGFSINVKATPPATIIREKATVTAATCLADHGINIDLHELMNAFDIQFAAIQAACPAFIDVLKRISFADPITGEIVLQSHNGGALVRGFYHAFSAEKPTPTGVWVEYLHLQNAENESIALPLKSYTTRAQIKNPYAIGTSEQTPFHAIAAL